MTAGTRLEPLGPLGPGAPGRALLVLDRATGWRVAGKRLTPPAGVPAERIRAEAMRLGGPHPSINPVLDVVADGDAVWVLSPAVPGRSLRAEVHRRGALGPAAAAAIGLPVLAALTYAHEHGVVHGNLHPGNVLLAADGRVWVGDFGIPALAGQTMGGLPGFTAPDAPSPAADLWSLGAVLYTAALGVPPFQRATPAATAEAVREGVALDPTDPFTALLRDLLATDPARRPGPAAIRIALQNASAATTHDVPTRRVTGPPDPAAPASRPRRSRLPRIRTRILIPALAGAAVLGAAAALLVPADALSRLPGGRPPAVAPGGNPAAALAEAGPFTKVPDVCGLLPADLVAELVPSAGAPHRQRGADRDSCTWYSDHQTPAIRRGTLSVRVHRRESASRAKGDLAVSRRLKTGSVQDLREVSGLGHEAFAYTEVRRGSARRYQVGYRARLSNLEVGVEYARAVGVDPDGSIAQGAETVTRAVLDALVKRAE